MANYYKINWDTDGENVEELGLPKYVEMPDDFDGDLANWLSDEYGWCINGFEPVDKEDIDE